MITRSIEPRNSGKYELRIDDEAEGVLGAAVILVTELGSRVWTMACSHAEPMV